MCTDVQEVARALGHGGSKQGQRNHLGLLGMFFFFNVFETRLQRFLWATWYNLIRILAE